MMSTEPDAWGRERQLDEVVLAYLKARETDSNLDQQTWIDCYPDLKGDLSDFFRDQARIEQLANSLRLLTDSAEKRPVSNITLPWREAESAAAGPGVTTVQVLGDYEILGELGKGGMGVVYKARQRSLKRIVALKMILSGVHASSEELTRFRREAEAVARLQHPNIVQIYEVGELDHTPFFSLEFVEGGSLAAQLDGTPLPPRSAAQMVRTLANAIQFAHEQGIVHRDLKPANILLGASNLAGFFGRVRPQGDLVAAAAVEGECDGGSPCSGTKYGDSAHAFFFAPMRDSVPASRRRMFSWCLAMISRATANCTAMNKGGRSPRTSSHANGGKLAAPRIEASET